jgi:TPR repeat protein
VTGRAAGVLLATSLAGAQAACASIDAPAPHPPARPEIGSVCAVGGCAPVATTTTANVESCGERRDCAREPAAVCDESRPHACTTRALDVWAVTADGAGGAPVLALFDRACELGDPYGCMYAGRILLDGVGVGPDEARGRTLLERACDDELVVACDALARHERDAPPVASEKQFEGARYEAEAACWRGDSAQCFSVGLAFDSGRNGYPRDLALSVRAYRRGCDLGEAVSCNNLANDEYYGDGTPLDWASAARVYAKACDLGEKVACANVGFIAEYGDGVPRDMKRAEEAYREACTLESAYGCIHLDMLAAYESGVPHAPDKAVARWRSACEAPTPSQAATRACAYYGVMLEDGKGVARDSERATSLMRRACGAKWKYQPACQWVAEHP